MPVIEEVELDGSAEEILLPELGVIEPGVTTLSGSLELGETELLEPLELG